MESSGPPASPQAEWTVRMVSLGVLLALIVILGITFYQVLAPFLLPLFLAAVMAIVCQPLHRRVLRSTGPRPAIAAGVTTGLIVGLLMLPLLVTTVLAAGQLLQLTDQVTDQVVARRGGANAAAGPEKGQQQDWKRAMDVVWKKTVDPALAWSDQFVPLKVDSDKLKVQFEQNVQGLVKNLGERTFQIATSTVGWFVSLLIAFGMFLVALYYFLADGAGLLQATKRLIPVQTEHQQKLAEQFAKVVRAVVLATFLAAFVQGLATTLALQVCGLGHFVIFLALSTVAALIPLAGTWIIWGPCAVWLAAQGHVGSAIGLALYGILVVGLLDNVVRTYVLNTDVQLHPLLAFVSVLGVLQVMGLWGVFIGPIVASCLYALLQIFNTELGELSTLKKQPQAGT